MRTYIIFTESNFGETIKRIEIVADDIAEAIEMVNVPNDEIIAVVEFGKGDKIF